jgi:hypothetical protein
VTVTVAERDVVPPAPLQLRTKVVVCVSAALVCEPESDLAPDHPPEAVQDVAFAEDQLSSAVPPCATWLGVALRVTVGSGGAALTATVAVRLVVPPAPVQLSV